MADHINDPDALDIFAQCIQVMIMEKWLSLSSIYALSRVNKSLDCVTCAPLRRLKYLRSIYRPRFAEKIRDFIMHRKKVCWKNVPVSHLTTPISELMCSSRGIRICAPSSEGERLPPGAIIHTIMLFTYTNNPIYVTIIINNEPVCGKIIKTGILCSYDPDHPLYCRTMRVPEILSHESVDLSVTEWRDDEIVHSTDMDLEFCIQNISRIRLIYGEYEKHYDFWRQNINPDCVTPFRAEGLMINGKIQHCTKSLLTYTKPIEKNVVEHLTDFAKRRNKTLSEMLRILYNYSIDYYGKTFVDILLEYFSMSPLTNIMFLPVCSDQTVLGLRFDISNEEKAAGGNTEKAAGGNTEKAVLVIPAIHVLIAGDLEEHDSEEYRLDFPDIDIRRVIENLAMRHFTDPDFLLKSDEYTKKLKIIRQEMSNL